MEGEQAALDGGWEMRDQSHGLDGEPRLPCGGGDEGLHRGGANAAAAGDHLADRVLVAVERPAGVIFGAQCIGEEVGADDRDAGSAADGGPGE